MLGERPPVPTKTPVVQVVTPLTPPTNLPMVEPAFAQGSVMVKKGEVAHSVSHIEQPTPPKPPVPVPTKTEPEKVSLPDYRYPGGKDPYREPLQ